MRADDELAWSEWMRRAQAGDARAYASLLASLSRAITGYIYHRFGSVEFADDCVQESLMALHEARHTFLEGRPIRPWVFAIVRNRAIDMLRRQKRRQQLFPRDLDAADPDAEERRELAGKVLASLPAPQKEALVFTKLMGLSVSEAAIRAGVSTGAMKVRVHRATQAAIRVLEAERE
jgi:RNA polymerase sigma-70 factor (ECF subfamily)